MTAVVISFDFELGWGVLEQDNWRRRESAGVYSRMREDIPKLLRLLRQSEIPTTWAVVTNMLAESNHDMDIEHLPQDYRDQVNNFLNHANPTTVLGLDLFEQVAVMDTLCEIGSHSASHIYGSHPSVTAIQYSTDIQQSTKRLEKILGSPVSSLVFPRDQDNYRLQVAQKIPKLNMRLNPKFGESQSTVDRGISGLLDFIRPVKKSQTMVGASGEIYQTGSLNFNAFGGRYKFVKKQLLQVRLKRLAKQLNKGKNGDLYHIWLHPFNLSESSLNFSLFKDFLALLESLREAGTIKIETMSSIGELCRK